MKLIVGLGNPGSRYERTRHNVGFMLLDKLALDQNVVLREGHGDYFLGEYKDGDDRVFLMKPTTYMNNSGLAVRDVAQFYKIAHQDILIVCDDVSFPVGKIRMRKDGSDGGQNGLRSVIYQLGHDRIARLRIGIDHVLRTKMDLADFVLSKFLKEEESELEKVIALSAEAAMSFIRSGIDKAMNAYNGIVITKI